MGFAGFFDDYDKSIKNSDVEEKYDLVFSRPLGFVFAKLLHKLGFTPTGISFLGLIIGVAGGILLFWQNSLTHTATGGFLIIFAGILDSSDGQAARLYNAHTEIGRYLDGIIDNLVFIACYTAAIFAFVDTYTFLGCFVIGALAGASHSIKSCIYEYYKGEFLYYSGCDSSQRNASVEEINTKFDRSTIIRKLVHLVVIDYMRKQKFFKFRDDSVTQKLEYAKRQNGLRLEQIYVKENKPMLSWWAWVGGSNVMRNSIIIFSLFGRFDYFAFLNIASFLVYQLIGKYQNKIDDKILKRVGLLQKTTPLQEKKLLQ